MTSKGYFEAKFHKAKPERKSGECQFLIKSYSGLRGNGRWVGGWGEMLGFFLVRRSLFIDKSEERSIKIIKL